jgi:hypothetical protein
VAPGQLQGTDGEIAERGHGPRPGSGADLGLVFAVEGGLFTPPAQSAGQ